MTSSRGSSRWALAFALTAGSLALVVGACRLDQPTTIKPVATAGDPEGPVDVYPIAEGEAADTVAVPTLVIPRQDTLRGPGFVLTADSIVVADESVEEAALRLFRAAQDMRGLQEGPAMTPREVEPELRNRTEFARAMERAYPALLKDAGIGGRVLMWLLVDTDGRVAAARLFESSGYPQLDEAAMQVIRTAIFSPALNRGVAVPVWIALPVTFQTTTSAAPWEARPAFTPSAASPVQALSPPADTGLAARPAFTPREVEPSFTNVAEFLRELDRAYPSMLKDAGIGGRVTLWVFVDASGRVANVQLFESSGYPELDAAAESVIRGTARFSGARNRGQLVPVWIALPVTFQTSP